MAGVSLGGSRLGSALGFNVVAILRGDQKILAPQPETLLQKGDRLMVIGRLEQLEDFSNWQQLTIVSDSVSASALVSDQIEIVEIRFSSHSA